MTDREFLAAMRIKDFSMKDVWLEDPDPLAAALRIDDLRSVYCERLEKLVDQLTLEIQKLRRHPRIRSQEPRRPDGERETGRRGRS
jgi:hypothetical protein